MKREMQRLIGENLHGGDINNTRVLSYQTKAPAPPEGYQNPLKVLYSQAKTPASVRASTRYIPQAPDRILDAPEIIDDYCKQSLLSHFLFAERYRRTRHGNKDRIFYRSKLSGLVEQ